MDFWGDYMKAITSNQEYKCTGLTVGNGTVRYALESALSALGGTVELQDDSGRVLRTDTVANYLRNYVDGTTLVLTNTPEPAAPDLETVRTAKLDELSAAAQAAIIAGCDVTLSDGTTGHISLTPEDQINLSTAQAAVQAGASGYPYHLDGQLCKVYSAEDILIMGKAAVAHILYHTTYCNHLRTWAQRATDQDELTGITYGAVLPDDLKANMEAIISAATA